MCNVVPEVSRERQVRVCNTDFGLLSGFNLAASLCKPIINNLWEVNNVLSKRNLLIGEVNEGDKIS